MKVLVTLAIMSLCACNPVFQQLMDVISTQPIKQQFKLWHFALQRPYDLNSDVAIQKYKVFKANLKFIEDANSNQKDYKLGLGPFSDLTWEEFKQDYLAIKEVTNGDSVVAQTDAKIINFDLAADNDDDDDYPPKPLENEYKNYSPKPIDQNNNTITSKDWRKLHTVARDQSQCGSCWAFATVAALEGQLLIKNDNTDLSEQELVDCTGNQPGCKGGWYHLSFGYVQSQGIAKEQDYRYIANHRDFYQSCKARSAPRYIKGFRTLLSCSAYDFTSSTICTPSLIKDHMDKGPVATLIEVGDGLQHYRQGQWLPNYCKMVNHAVELVYFTYNTVSRTGISVIRNSWGNWWGNNGLGEVAIRPSQGLLGCGTLLHSFIGLDFKF